MTTEFCIFELVYIPYFQLKLTILDFGAKFAQQGFFRSKTAKVDISIEFSIFKLVLVPMLKLTILNFGTIFV